MSFAIDFGAALKTYWEADPTLAAITPMLFHDLAPNGPTVYPLAILAKVGGTADELNAGRGYVDVDHYQVGLFHPDRDSAVLACDSAHDVLKTLNDNPLTFTGGYQMEFMPGHHSILRSVHHLRGTVYVWMAYRVYRVKIGRTR